MARVAEKNERRGNGMANGGWNEDFASGHCGPEEDARRQQGRRKVLEILRGRLTQRQTNEVFLLAVAGFQFLQKAFCGYLVV